MRVPVALLTVALLAGCADVPTHAEETFEVIPGALQGVVVDETISPLAGATVTASGLGNATTDDEGRFVFEDVEPGVYFLEATATFYDVATTSVEVNADSPIVRMQLTRVIFDAPFIETEVFEGFLACSSNVGGIIAEECGEGVGVPGYGRVGTHPNNQPQVEFFATGPRPQTIQGEIVWTPSLRINDDVQSGDFTTIMATYHVCDPICGYVDKLDDKVGGSPMVMRTDDGDQGGGYFTQPDVPMAEANITAETPIAIFVWQSDQDLAGVQFEQRFNVYRTVSYVLPLPDGWSLARGDESPF